MNVLHRIIESIKAHVMRNKAAPTTMHLSFEEEWDMGKLTHNDVGSLADEILAKGPVRAIDERGGTLLGLKVVWHAAKFRVE